MTSDKPAVAREMSVTAAVAQIAALDGDSRTNLYRQLRPSVTVPPGKLAG